MWVGISTLVLWGVIIISGTFAQAEEQRVASLRSLTGVAVTVEAMDPEAERDGLTSTQLQTDVELRLRNAGIQILPDVKNQDASEAPDLYVKVNAIKSELGSYALTISVSLRQWMVLKDNPDVRIFAPTWTTSAMAIIGEQRLWKVRGYVVDQVDKFIRVYYVMNSQDDVKLAKP